MYGRRHPFLVTLTADDAGGSGSPQGEPEQATNADADTKADEAAADDADDADDVDDEQEWDRDRAMRKIRKANAEAKALRERAKAAEEAAKETPDLKAQIADLQAENLRLQVASELGLPAQIATRLQGGTREELLADAEELLKLVGGKTPPTSKPANGFGESHTNNQTSSQPVDLDKLAEEFMTY